MVANITTEGQGRKRKKKRGKKNWAVPTCKYSFGKPLPIRCACFARTARTLANLVVAALSTSSRVCAAPPSSSDVCAGGKAVAFGLKALSVSFVSKRKEKAALSICFITMSVGGESIRSDVSSRSRRRDGETGSAVAPSFASTSAEGGIPDSARIVGSSDLGGRRKSSHFVLWRYL